VAIFRLRSMWQGLPARRVRGGDSRYPGRPASKGNRAAAARLRSRTRCLGELRPRGLRAGGPSPRCGGQSRPVPPRARRGCAPAGFLTFAVGLGLSVATDLSFLKKVGSAIRGGGLVPLVASLPGREIGASPSGWSAGHLRRWA